MSPLFEPCCETPTQGLAGLALHCSNAQQQPPRLASRKRAALGIVKPANVNVNVNLSNDDFIFATPDSVVPPCITRNWQLQHAPLVPDSLGGETESCEMEMITKEAFSSSHKNVAKLPTCRLRMRPSKVTRSPRALHFPTTSSSSSSSSSGRPVAVVAPALPLPLVPSFSSPCNDEVHQTPPSMSLPACITVKDLPESLLFPEIPSTQRPPRSRFLLKPRPRAASTRLLSSASHHSHCPISVPMMASI